MEFDVVEGEKVNESLGCWECVWKTWSEVPGTELMPDDTQGGEGVFNAFQWGCKSLLGAE